MQATDAPTQASTHEELTLRLGALMKHLLGSTGREFFAEMERRGLGIAHVKTLGILADSEEPLSLKALSEQLGLSLPGISRSVDVLVQRGLVKRKEDPEDRRAKRVELTAKGRRTFEALIELRLAALDEWVAQLDPDERDALSRGVRAVERHIG
jgi:DNA-binding MarR family transcriptional regulator